MDTVYFNGVAVRELGGILRGVSWTAPKKKTYIVDIPGADGELDMASWFGGPRYEARTMTIALEAAGGDARKLWDRLAQSLYSGTHTITLSNDPGYYWRGDVQSIVASAGYPGEVVITVRVDPYKYAVSETVRDLAEAETDTAAEIPNMGSRVEIPTVTVTGDSLRIVCGETVVNMTAGIYAVPELAVLPRSTLQLHYTGGPGQIAVREAYL